MNKKYRIRLNKARQFFEKFCNWAGEVACPAKVNTVRAFLGWLEIADLASQVQEYFGAIVRVHKKNGFSNLVNDFRVKEVVRGIKLVGAQGKEANWPRDSFPIEALRKYHDSPPEKVNLVIWCRDLALVALGFHTMRRPGELGKLKVKDVEERSGLVWIRIRKSKNDPFANRRFVPVEPTESRICLIQLLNKYLRVRLSTSCDEPLFLSNKKGEMSVAAISSVIKRMIEHAKLKDRFTAHSLRIGEATAAMKGGMSLIQIRTIGGGIRRQLCCT